MSGRRSSESISISKRKAFILVSLTGFTLGASIALINSPNPFGTATVSKVDSAEFNGLLDSVSNLENEIKKIKRERDDARRELRAATKKEAELLKQLDAKDEDASGEACLDRHAVWEPSSKRSVKDPELAEVLKEVAVNNELLVAVSNINYAAKGGMLDTWMDGVKRAGVKNALVVALDDQTKRNVEERGLRAFRMDLEIPETQKKAGSNHAVSSLKFRILQRFMKLGYSVLLSDVDVVTLDDPFKHLVRDSDVESMSDGYDQPTAYGYNDVFDDESMGWSRYAHTMRIFVFNSGLFYMRPSDATMDLLDKVINHLETRGGWDQAVFNECIFFPNSPINKDPSITRRAMDIHKFMNSKVLFKFLRHSAGLMKSTKPAMIHVNYHPNKFERMQAIVKYYVNGEENALDEFPDGSE